MLRALSATALALLLTALAASPAAAELPDPIEFELSPPAPAGAASAARQGFVSDPLRAPQRFNLVGLRWRGKAEPEIAVRARRAGGKWTRWTPATGHHSVSTSEPVWVGKADWVQYRMSRRVPRLRLHFVNSMPTAQAAAKVARKRSRKRARGSRGGPRIRPRSAWGAAKCPTRRVGYGKVKAALVHHTVTANEYTKRQAPAAILAVCRFHRYTNGWDDIGYNFVVDRFGRIWEGRGGGVDEAVVGAQAQGYNAQTTGISNLGTFTSVPQSDRAIGAMARLIRWKLANHGVRTNGRTRLTSAGGPAARYPAGTKRAFYRVSGHRDTGVTACPGEALYRQLPELRERVGERLHPGAPLRIEAPLPEQVTYAPDGVDFGGRVTDRNALPVEGLAFELQQLERLGWTTLASGVSRADGTFSASAPMTASSVLRWRFAGDSTWRPYRGDGALVGVAPAISLSTSAAQIEPGERVRVTGSFAPPKPTATLVLERSEGDDVWRRVRKKRLNPGNGRFGRTLRLHDQGDYRFWVYFAGDASNAETTSPYAYVRVVDPLLPFR